MKPYRVYLTLEFVSSLLFSLIFTVNMVYQVTVVQLTPFQLVLMGTILETSVFVFEVPTGVLADVKSRRLSVIIGYCLIGAGFVLEGSLPLFWTVALAQVVWGLGYTFTSGATQAWIADEVGEERAGEAFLQGAQAGRIGALAAIPISIALGTIAVNLPIVIGGGLMILLSIFLILSMTEEGFTPTPVQDRTTWHQMRRTVSDAQKLTRRQPVLLVLLGIGLFFGLYSEGFDRLWTAHLLESFSLGVLEEIDPVVWFGILRAAMLLIGLGATELARRRIDTRRAIPMATTLMAIATLIIATLAAFGLTRHLWTALVLYLAIGALRTVAAPLQTAWYNLLIDDPQVRATMFSITNQVDAIGQIAGGPAVGAIGNLSIRAALVTSALILSPVLPLYGYAIRKTKEGILT